MDRLIERGSGAKRWTKRFGAKWLKVLRTMQLIFTAFALIGGGYVINRMNKLPHNTEQLHEAIHSLADLRNRTDITSSLGQQLNLTKPQITTMALLLSSTFDPVLTYLEESPAMTKATVAVAVLSAIAIIYLMVAQRMKDSRPEWNRRSWRIGVEIFILVLWIGGTISTIMLVVGFRLTVQATSADAKSAYNTLQPLITAVLAKMNGDQNTGDGVFSFSQVVEIGVGSIIIAGCSFVCFIISWASLTIEYFTGRGEEAEEAEEKREEGSSLPDTSQIDETKPRTPQNQPNQQNSRSQHGRTNEPTKPPAQNS